MSQHIADIQTKSIAEKKTNFRWIIAVLIFVVYTIAAADRANIGVALPYIRKEFQMSNTEAGGLVSLFLLAYAIAQIPSGFAYSKFGVRRILSFAMIMTSIFTGLIGSSGSPLMMKVYRFGLGLAEGPLPIGITSTINNWFPPREKGFATGIFLSAAKFGPVLVPPLCALIIQMSSWHYIFYLFSLPGIFLAATWYILVRNYPSESPHCSPAEVQYIESEQVSQEAVAQKKPYSLRWLDRLVRARKAVPLDTNARVFRSWDIWGSTFGYFFMMGIVNVLLAWIPTYLVSVKHFTIMKMGFVASAPWVGAVIGNLLGGWFSDKVINKRRKPLMMITSLSTTFMMYSLINAPNDPVFLGTLLFVTGILLNLGFSAYMVYPMGLTTKKTFPIAGSVINTGGQLGGACAPLITGMILDAYNWDAVFMFLAASSFVSLLVISTISEPVEDPLNT
jgi:ACS family glucarate transporter-like MFS transporter